jgi:hypothetical protein
MLPASGTTQSRQTHGQSSLEDHAQAPASIQSTREFASLCLASSAFMIKQL